MQNEYNMPPKQYTFLRLQLEIQSVVDETSILFYFASRKDRAHMSFTKEKADALLNIMRRGQDHTETMVRCYYKHEYGMHDYELEKMQKWAEQINNNIHLFESREADNVKETMQKIERCFELITSNGWVK